MAATLLLQVPRSMRRSSPASVMRLTGDAIQSKFFWIYLQMLQSLSSVLKHMTAWSHSCPCHSVHARDLIGQQAEEVDQDRKKVQEKRPVRGLRAHAWLPAR